MTTDDATGTLADIDRTGDADTRAERDAERHLWAGLEHADREDWGRADYSLEAAYHALGAVPPPATADDFARGKHPIVAGADRRWREEFGED